MQKSYIHSSYRQQIPAIRTATPPVQPVKHAAPANQTRILSSRFFLLSLDSTKTGPAARMQLKITNASSAPPHTNYGPKTIPHSLYDDPAFSADPSSNPLRSSSHDITPWAIDPPKGHPTIKHREAPKHIHETRTLIQPPNSPVFFNAHQQTAVSTLMHTSPDLSSPASTTSDSSLPTPGTSCSSLITSQTDIRSKMPSEGNKKRIGLSFFKRKSQTADTPKHRLHKDMPSNPPVSHNSSRSEASGPGDALNGGTNRKSLRMARGQPTAKKSQELDMIDELDESNPLGIALHHGGPYEAIQKAIRPQERIPRVSHKPSQQPPPVYDQPFRFDVPLNLSPGQVLPHSVASYYRPVAPLGPSANVHDQPALAVPNYRADQSPPLRAPIVNGAMGPIMRHPSRDHSATSLTPSQASRPSTHSQPSDLASGPQQSSERIEPVVSQVKPSDAQLASEREQRITPPAVQPEQHFIPDKVEDRGYGITVEEAVDEADTREQDATCPPNDQGVSVSNGKSTDDARLPYLEGDDAEAPSRVSPQESPRNTPPSRQEYLPPSLAHKQHEPPAGPLHDHRAYDIQSRVSPHEPPRNTPHSRQEYLPPSLAHKQHEPPAGPLHDHRVYDIQSGVSPHESPRNIPPSRPERLPPTQAHKQHEPLAGPLHDHRAYDIQSRVSPHEPPRNTPPSRREYLPPTQAHKQYEPLAGPLHDHRAYDIQSRVSPHEPPRNTPPSRHEYLPPSQAREQYGLPAGPLHDHRVYDIQSRVSPHESPRNTPPSRHEYLPPSQAHKQYELPAGPLHDHRVYDIQSPALSGSSIVQSGASSIITGSKAPSIAGSSASSKLTRNRILPRHLVMPAPLAKAAASSRPQPTHRPQSVQYWQDMQRQHRVLFRDGTEYELPVTTSTQSMETRASVVPSPEPIKHRNFPPAHGGKLRKHSSLRGPESPEIVARLAAAPHVAHRRKYMEPPPTIPEAPRIDKSMSDPVKKDMKRLLSKRRTML